MRYSIGDIVRFKNGSDELHLGEIQFIEKTQNEAILYINSFSGWAYKVSEKRIVAPVPKKVNLHLKFNKSFLTKGVGLQRGETNVSPQS